MEFIDVVLYPGLPEDGAGHNATADVPNRKTVRARRRKKVIGCLPTAAARHELNYDGGVSRNVFLQKRQDRFRPYVARAACLDALKNFDRLPLIKRRLRISMRRKSEIENNAQNPNCDRYSCWHCPPPGVNWLT